MALKHMTKASHDGYGAVSMQTVPTPRRGLDENDGGPPNRGTSQLNGLKKTYCDLSQARTRTISNRQRNPMMARKMIAGVPVGSSAGSLMSMVVVHVSETLSEFSMVRTIW